MASLACFDAEGSETASNSHLVTLLASIGAESDILATANMLGLGAALQVMAALSTMFSSTLLVVSLV